MTSERAGELRDTHIALAHGNGGRMMRELIELVFAPALANPALDTRADAVSLPPIDGAIMVTTDGFTVRPLEFPGGDIGSLAVHGTVNDLAVAGATPLYLTLNTFIEEGLEVELLRRLAESIGRAARACGVSVVAGDTKVVGRGECDGVYLATTGIGVRRRDLQLGLDRIRAGDVIFISGPVGDHGAAVMLAREEFGMQGELRSDAASVLPFAQALWPIQGLRFMRDPTRGGLATVLNEIANATGRRVRVRERDIPIRDPVQSVCELLGFDPLYLACEGQLLAVASQQSSDAALDALRRVAPEGAMIGDICDGSPQVILDTSFGGQRVLDELEDDPLPRIC
jgi:hydrogenase expression/formation protein HypE